MAYVWPKSLPSVADGLTSRYVAPLEGHSEREESIDDTAKKEPKPKRVTQEGVYRSVEPVDKAARHSRRL